MKKAAPQAVAALGHRNYRLYWSGQLVSLVGTWMQSIGLIWLVLEATHSALQVGLIGALQALPLLLFSLFGGVLADRWPKRRLLVWTQVVSLGQALLLFALIATGALQLWELYLLTLLLGITNSVYRPASQAFLVELAGRDDLLNAVALNSFVATLARIVGPSLAGLLIATRGVAPLFLLNAVSFLAVLAALALIRSHELYAQSPVTGSDSGARTTTWQSVREGLGYVRRTPTVLLVIVVMGLVLLFGSNFNVILPIFAATVLHAGAQDFGFLSAMFGAGSLLAALWLALRNPAATTGGTFLASLAFSVLVLAFGLAHGLAAALVIIAAIGATEMVFTALAVTTVQTAAPDHLRGRVMSVLILSFDGSVPPGYVFTGWLAGVAGVATTLLICGSLCLLTCGGGWLLLRSLAE